MLYRQHVARLGRLLPFFEVGAGVLWTELDVKELGGDFQFQLQGGGGLRYLTGATSSLDLSLRYYHLSNGGLRSPNTGLNGFHVLVGYSWFR
jgi:lipid A 3-O-deacylase